MSYSASGDVEEREVGDDADLLFSFMVSTEEGDYYEVV